MYSQQPTLVRILYFPEYTYIYDFLGSLRKVEMTIGEGAFPSSLPCFYPLPPSLPSLPSIKLPPPKRGETANHRSQRAEQSLKMIH